MSKEYRAKVFRTGNSVALRLPKALGLRDGDEMVLREEQGRYEFEPVPKPKDRIDLMGLYGSCPGLRPLESEDREMEPRALDWNAGMAERD